MLPPWLKKLVLSLFKKEVMVVSNRLNELLEKVLVEYEEKQGEHHLQGMDLMDVLLAAYRDEKAEYKITRNHIKSFYAVNKYSFQEMVSLRIKTAMFKKMFLQLHAGSFICRHYPLSANNTVDIGRDHQQSQYS